MTRRQSKFCGKSCWQSSRRTSKHTNRGENINLLDGDTSQNLFWMYWAQLSGSETSCSSVVLISWWFHSWLQLYYDINYIYVSIFSILFCISRVDYCLQTKEPLGDDKEHPLHPTLELTMTRFGTVDSEFWVDPTSNSSITLNWS